MFQLHFCYESAGGKEVLKTADNSSQLADVCQWTDFCLRKVGYIIIKVDNPAL